MGMFDSLSKPQVGQPTVAPLAVNVSTRAVSGGGQMTIQVVRLSNRLDRAADERLRSTANAISGEVDRRLAGQGGDRARRLGDAVIEGEGGLKAARKELEAARVRRADALATGGENLASLLVVLDEEVTRRQQRAGHLEVVLKELRDAAAAAKVQEAMARSKVGGQVVLELMAINRDDREAMRKLAGSAAFEIYDALRQHPEVVALVADDETVLADISDRPHHAESPGGGVGPSAKMLSRAVHGQPV